MMEFPPIVLIIGSYFGMAAGVWALFDRADKALNEPAKKSIAEWLQNINPTIERSKWPSQFIEIFDSVFGEKHLSWKCFFRSCLASIIALNVLGVVYIGIRGEPLWGNTWFLVNIFLLYLWGGIINLIPDYLSLLETRFVLRLMSKPCSYLKIFVLLILDIVITFLGFLAVIMIIDPTNPYNLDDFFNLLRDILGSFTFSGDGGAIGIFLYTTFFTSIWVWLYALSGLGIKIYQRFGREFIRFKSILDIKNKPLFSLGFVSNLIILFIYIVGFGFFYEGEYW